MYQLPLLHDNCHFYARQHAIAQQFRLSVRPSVTRVDCIKPAEHIFEILSLSDRPINLVFRHQGLLRKSDGFSLTGEPNIRGVAIFDQYAAISRKR